MNDGNWIKLNRAMLKWEWYDDVNTKAVFLHALLKANYEDGAYRGHKLNPGDVVFGRKKWAEQLGMTERQVRTAIEHLKETGEISTTKTTNRFTVLRIENWALYQSNDEETTSKATNKRPTSDQQATNKRPRTKKEKKEKNDKNDKNTNPPISPQGEIEAVVNQLPFELRAPVNEFIEHRQEIKRPFTVRSLKMTLKKLNEYSAGDIGKSIQIIEQSIANGWQGIFPLEDKAKPRNEALDMLKRGLFNDEDGNITDINLFKRSVP